MIINQPGFSSHCSIWAFYPPGSVVASPGSSGVISGIFGSSGSACGGSGGTGGAWGGGGGSGGLGDIGVAPGHRDIGAWLPWESPHVEDIPMLRIPTNIANI